MAKFVKQNNEWILALSPSEAQSLGLKERDFELHKAKEGLLVLVEKAAPPQPPKPNALPKPNPLDARIFSLLEKKNLQDRVEGKFESFLSKDELLRFKELLKSNQVEAFKLSPQYQKAVYQIPETAEQPMNPTNSPGKPDAAMEKPSSVSVYSDQTAESAMQSLEKNGFAIALGESIARDLSDQLSDAIRDKEVIGIRGFDGNFYIASEYFFETGSKRLEDAFSKQKTANVQELSQKTGIPIDGVKTLCELLKEEGALIEKRKGLMQWIG